MTALLLLARARRCCSRARSSPRRRRSSTSPTTSRSWRAAVRNGPRASSCAQFPQPAPTPRCRRALADPATPQTFERCKLDFARARSARDGATRCTAICCALRRERSGVPRAAAAAASTARCSAPRPSCCASSPTSTATIGCCSSTSGAICTATSFAEPLLAPPAGCDWAAAVVERGRRATAAAAPPTSGPDDGWRIPGDTARVVLAPHRRTSTMRDVTADVDS